MLTATGLAALAAVLALVMPQLLRWIVDGPVARRRPAELVFAGVCFRHPDAPDRVLLRDVGLRVADRVVVLADGRVVEDCAPADLRGWPGSRDGRQGDPGVRTG
ncbi:hypothetical protein [Streptomyces sp. NPDC021224]|uniref:hypothetical protein n=1 Tax=unclassified Streptomyces TaxID=2593676 RepID=UPI00379A9BE0